MSKPIVTIGPEPLDQVVGKRRIQVSVEKDGVRAFTTYMLEDSTHEEIAQALEHQGFFLQQDMDPMIDQVDRRAIINLHTEAAEEVRRLSKER